MPPEVIQTERLELKSVRSCSPRKLHETFNVENEEEVFSLCGWSKHHEIETTEEFIQKADEQWRSDERYRYAVVLSEEGMIVGTTYIDVSTHSNAGILGLWIDKPYWGRGISGERADALIELAFETLELSHIRVGCLSENSKSRRAIEKYISRHGGVFYGVPPVNAESYSSYPQATRPHYEYAIRREDYYNDQQGIECTIPGFSYQDVEF